MDVWNDPDPPPRRSGVHLMVLAVLVALACTCLMVMGLLLDFAVGGFPAPIHVAPAALAILPSSLCTEVQNP